MVQPNSTEQALFSEFTEWRFQDSPEFATMFGIHKYDDQLESYSLASFESRRTKVVSLLERAKQLRLDKAQQCEATCLSSLVDLDLFIEMLQIYLDGFATKSYVFPLARIDGLNVELAQIISYMKFETADDFNKLTRRLRAVPAQIEGVVEIMREGIRSELTLHSISLKNVVESLTDLVNQEPSNTPYYTPVAESKLTLTDSQKMQVIEGIREAQKGLSVLRDFIRDEYLAACRKNIGVSSLPNGEAYYAECLKHHLGYAAKPSDVHDIGLKEVARINNEIKKVITELGLQDTPKDFAEKMRQDPQFILGSQEEIKDLYKCILEERIQPQLSKYFRTVPQAKLNLELVSASRAAGPAAYYIQGAVDGSRPGMFYINGNDVRRSPTYIMPALALHEANPGHHLQGSRLLETRDLASFRLLMEDRRYTDMPTHFPLHTAYIEGWGLYSESLGHEMGVYHTPYEKYGHYSQEILRACRLVVDTGMHAFNWTRQQAIDFMLEHTASSLSEIESEVDRYITWPGQACGYKIGELRIKQLRQKANDALGSAFDIRDFHEVVMNHMGTLAFLEKGVDAYIAKQRK